MVHAQLPRPSVIVTPDIPQNENAVANLYESDEELGNKSGKRIGRNSAKKSYLFSALSCFSCLVLVRNFQDST